MSVGILLSTLSNDVKKQIASELHLEAKDKYYFVPKDDKKHFYTGGEVVKSLNMFSIEGDIIYLPFAYVREKFKVTKPNDRLNKKKYQKFKMKEGFSLRDYQKEAIRYAFEDFDKFDAAFFNVFCSYGKTVVATFIAHMMSQMMQTSTLILVPQDSIVSSWYSTFVDLTTASVYVVGSNSLTREANRDTANVIICPCHQIDKMSKEQVQNIGFLVIDEADCYCTIGHVNTLLATQPYRILALTATYERDDCMESMIDLVVGPSRIVKISSKPFFILKISTPFTATDVAKTSRGISHTDLTRKICNIPQRLSIILNLVMNNSDEKILILSLHTDIVELLCGSLEYLFEQRGDGKKVSKYYGKMDGYYDADVLIGTYSKLGRGFDQKGKCKGVWDGRRFNFLILVSSTLKVEQLAGRAFRSDIPCIVEFVDNHENVRKHWAKRYKWYVSRNGIVMDIKTMFKWSDLFLTPEYQTQYRLAKVKEANEAIAPTRIVKESCIPAVIEALNKEKKGKGKGKKRVEENDGIDEEEELAFLRSLSNEETYELMPDLPPLNIPLITVNVTPDMEEE